MPLILAACATQTSEEPPLRLSGPGWTAQAPAGWDLERRNQAVIARNPDGGEQVAVAHFRLPKPFKPARWAKAKSELRKVADTIAVQTAPDAKVSAPQDAELAGRRALAFDITYERNGEARVDRLFFLLVGAREFQLTCTISLEQRQRGDAACEQLRTTFRLRA